MDARFCTPDDVPLQVSSFDSQPRQLGVGKAGKNGLLQAVFERQQEKTVVSDQMCQSPLYLQRPMYLEPSMPSLAHVYVMSSSGGILQGDRHRLDITLKRDSAVHITTQGATRIYSMDSNSATQMVNLRLDDGSYLEFLPDQIIPYRDSRYYQKLHCTVHDGATLFYSEMVAPGRIAMNESFEYDVCFLRTRVENQDGKLLFLDVVDLEPKRQDLSVPGILGRFAIMGSVYLFAGREHVSYLEGQIAGIRREGPVFGSSVLAHDSGILVRILGDSVEQVSALILEILRLVRRRVLGASFGGIRKS